MSQLLNDPAHWRARAAEARSVASKVDDPEGKRAMLEIARNYENLAERAERRLAAPQDKVS